MLNSVPAVVPGITLDPRVPLDSYRPTFVRSLGMVPVGGRNAVAAIGVYWARLHRPTPDEVAALQEFADLTKRAITRVGLRSAPPWGDVEPAC